MWLTGTRQIKYLEQNVAALNIKLSKAEMKELEDAVPQHQVMLWTGLSSLFDCKRRCMTAIGGSPPQAWCERSPEVRSCACSAWFAYANVAIVWFTCS